MSDAKNIIELNGKRYDIHTGKLIGDSATASMSQPKKPLHKPSSGMALDGFMKPSAPLHKPTLIVPTPPLAAKQRKAHEPGKPSDSTHQKVQRSQTLMRPGLKKPDKLSAKQKATPQPPAQILAKAPTGRLERAKAMSRSGLISKFTDAAVATTVTKRHESLPVAQAPARKAVETATHEVSHVAREAEKRFEHAIQNASSHLAELPKSATKKRRLGRKRNIFAGTVAAFLLIGFFGWQNLPNLEMRLATTRAGFSASLPGYSPAGYGISGNVKAEPNKVAVSYRSHTDDKGFTITQQKSDWSSQTLETQFIDANNQQKSSFPTGGKTIYLYGDSNATWVDGGIWYRVEGDASLTSDQLQRIANSF